jgi:hypothetical protein
MRGSKDRLVVCAVIYEPVSTGNSLLTGKNQRFRPFSVHSGRSKSLHRSAFLSDSLIYLTGKIGQFAFGDVLMLQAEMDRRCFLKENRNERLPVFASEFFMNYANGRLPARMQLDDIQLILRASHIQTLRKGELPPTTKPVGRNLASPSGQIQSLCPSFH